MNAPTLAAPATATPITTPCVVDGMSDQTYHADPVAGGSLSSTGARTLLSSPARYIWEQKHPVVKDAYDVGHVTHSKILGTGMQPVVIPESVLASNGAASTTEAKKFIADARAAGLVPLKADIIADIDEMAEAVLAHTAARALLEMTGKSEQSLFAPDPDTGVWLRARIDRLPDPGPGRTLAADVKTAVSADPRRFRNSAADYGYDVQSEWYQHTLRLARGDQDTAFLFIVVEKTRPYLVSVIELVGDFLTTGHDRMRRAITTYARCRETGEWPGYPGISYAEPPRWHVTQNEQEEQEA